MRSDTSVIMEVAETEFRPQPQEEVAKLTFWIVALRPILPNLPFPVQVLESYLKCLAVVLHLQTQIGTYD